MNRINNRRTPPTVFLLTIILLFGIAWNIFVNPPTVIAQEAGKPAKGAAKIQPAAVVTMNNLLKFEPAQVTIKVGETVEWQNTSLLVHTVTANPKLAANKEHVALPKRAEPFNSGNLDPKATFQHTFTVPGTYRYFCIPHEATGMVGEVIVKP